MFWLIRMSKRLFSKFRYSPFFGMCIANRTWLVLQFTSMTKYAHEDPCSLTFLIYLLLILAQISVGHGCVVLACSAIILSVVRSNHQFDIAGVLCRFCCYRPFPFHIEYSDKSHVYAPGSCWPPKIAAILWPSRWWCYCSILGHEAETCDPLPKDLRHCKKDSTRSIGKQDLIARDSWKYFLGHVFWCFS